ncbi:MAG: hypothetical protein IJP13_03340 [Lachnospiraceae bacterium]|nr:hypothetical protein [Lachnospiraceae bacterium]
MIRKFKYKIIDIFLKGRTFITEDNRGIGSIEMVLLILVILGIIVLFRDYIEALINTVFTKIDSQISSF